MSDVYIENLRSQLKEPLEIKKNEPSPVIDNISYFGLSVSGIVTNPSRKIILPTEPWKFDDEVSYIDSELPLIGVQSFDTREVSKSEVLLTSKDVLPIEYNSIPYSILNAAQDMSDSPNPHPKTLSLLFPPSAPQLASLTSEKSEYPYSNVIAPVLDHNSTIKQGYLEQDVHASECVISEEDVLKSRAVNFETTKTCVNSISEKQDLYYGSDLALEPPNFFSSAVQSASLKSHSGSIKNIFPVTVPRSIFEKTPTKFTGDLYLTILN